MQRSRIFIVEDQSLLSAMLLEILSAYPQYQVVGTATTAGEAFEALKTLEADVLLVDLMLPDSSGLELIESLAARRNKSKIVVCSAAGHEDAIAMAFALGVIGYVEKAAGIPELLEAIESASRGQLRLSPRTSDVLRRRLWNDDGRKRLLPGDLKILRRLAQQDSVEAIAKDLEKSISAVYKARRRIAQCIGAHTKRELYDAAVRMGLVIGRGVS